MRLVAESFGVTHVGKRRAKNEDAIFENAECSMWAVADGMGGHAHGELASRWITEALLELSRSLAHYDLCERMLAVEASVGRVHERLLKFSADDLAGAVCGSTCIALVASQGMAVCLWSGDSRLYRIRDGVSERLTLDHVSRVTHADGRVSQYVSRAIGAGEMLLDAACLFFKPGDLYLLCSDGLYNELKDDDIAKILSQQVVGQPVGLAQLGENLLSRVMQTEARDNVSFVLVRPSPSFDAVEALETVNQTEQSLNQQFLHFRKVLRRENIYISQFKNRWLSRVDRFLVRGASIRKKAAPLWLRDVWYRLSWCKLSLFSFRL
jgi:serine/threonine protein phosphatase PrpC